MFRDIYSNKQIVELAEDLREPFYFSLIQNIFFI